MFARFHLTEASVWYHVSLGLLAAVLLLTIGACFASWPGQLGFLCFAGCFAMYAASGSFDPDESKRKLPRPWKAMDWLLLSLRALSLPFALIVFAFGAGGPEIIDGQYCLTSHGEVISFISQESYLFRKSCEQVMWVGITLPFAADAAIRCRAVFLLSKS